jgi:ferric-dicitrate binding protein FerR (iron transport regulator)
MSSPDEDTKLARLAAQVLAADEPPAVGIGLGDRAADLAALERELLARARGRRRAWPALAGLAAAAGVALLVTWHRSAPAREPHPAASAKHPPSLSIAMLEGAGASIELGELARPVAVGEGVVAGTRLAVPLGAGVTLSLVTGTRIDVGGGTAVRVVELGDVQRFDLAGGTLAAKVAKLGPGGRFIITTPDAEVEVKGTRFEVSVGRDPSPCGPAVRTRVDVQEGVVAVRYASNELRVAAGSRWPDCQPGAAVAGPPAERHHAEERPHAKTHIAPAPPPDAPMSQPPPTSTLAEQNDLFAAALAASGRGDLDEAVHWLDRLIARYPAGQLTDSARAERRRLTEAEASRE